MSVLPAGTSVIAACLAAAPLLLAATDLRSGVALGGAIAATVCAVHAALAATRNESAGPYVQALWSSVVAAVASWLLAAWLPLSAAAFALLPLAAANPLAAQARDEAAALRLGIALALALAAVVIGSAREAAGAITPATSASVLAAFAHWLVSPPGLLFAAALLAAACNAVFRRTDQEPPTV